MPTLAIVGAGVAGLAAAQRLRHVRPDLEITIYEQSDRLGGRVATRRRDGFTFDHGAQVFRAPTAELLDFFQRELRAAGLRDIGRPVWTFDRAGSLHPGDPAQNAEPQWIYATGIDRLAELLAGDSTVSYRTPVAALSRESHGWALLSGESQVIATADLVLLTPPAPQTAAIIANSPLDSSIQASILAELNRVSYRRCISLALAMPRPIERPYYALVNSDRGHPISWLALEHVKGPERCPPGRSLLIAQMAPRWSVEHWETPLARFAPTVLELVRTLLGDDPGTPLWIDRHDWPAALPDGGADVAVLNRSMPGLFFAGDYTTGLGRVHLALESGWRVAERVGG